MLESQASLRCKMIKLAQMPLTPPRKGPLVGRGILLAQVATLEIAGPFLGEDDEVVGEGVRVAGTRRKVPGEMLAHGANGAHEALVGIALTNAPRQVVDDALPFLLGHALVDGGV